LWSTVKVDVHTSKYPEVLRLLHSV
jgi:hypothetical protein